MGALKFLTVSVAVSFILGCSPGRHSDPGPDAPSAAPPPKTVFDPLTNQLDHARDVQNTVDRNADRTRKAVENQEHGDNSP
jgi:hypothetical protein